MPRWAQSIRFRLSLAYALAVFTAGSVLVAGLYVWQVRQLDEPIIVQGRQVTLQDPMTGERFDTDLRLVTESEAVRVNMERFERRVYRESLNQLRRASLGALGVLFVVAFGSGWLLSGWTLRPMSRMVAVARDISGRDLSGRIGLRGPDDELKDLADAFDEMLERLQASFEDQRRFVQDTSHELRNPLAVAQANLELVLDDPNATAEDVRAAATIAHGATERIGRIVEDLVAQARQGVPATSTGPVDLDSVAAEVAAELRARASARSITLDAVGATGGPAEVTGRGPVVVGDGAALRRAVTNLVINAIRLAPVGSTITLATGTENKWAMISVSDEGPGISEREQPLVFQRFWRGADAGTGLGLGLSIVRQVAERHGGGVELVSAVGEGSTFTIRLPMPIARPGSDDSRPSGHQMVRSESADTLG